MCKEREEHICSKAGTFSVPFSCYPKVSQIICSTLIRNYDLEKSKKKLISFFWSLHWSSQKGAQSSLAERHRLFVSSVHPSHFISPRCRASRNLGLLSWEVHVSVALLHLEPVKVSNLGFFVVENSVVRHSQGKTFRNTSITQSSPNQL